MVPHTVVRLNKLRTEAAEFLVSLLVVLGDMGGGEA